MVGIAATGVGVPPANTPIRPELVSFAAHIPNVETLRPDVAVVNPFAPGVLMAAFSNTAKSVRESTGIVVRLAAL